MATVPSHAMLMTQRFLNKLAEDEKKVSDCVTLNSRMQKDISKECMLHVDLQVRRQ